MNPQLEFKQDGSTWRADLGTIRFYIFKAIHNSACGCNYALRVEFNQDGAWIRSGDVMDDIETPTICRAQAQKIADAWLLAVEAEIKPYNDLVLSSATKNCEEIVRLERELEEALKPATNDSNEIAAQIFAISVSDESYDDPNSAITAITKMIEAGKPRWLPIETAPKDGKEILLLCGRAGIPNSQVVAHYMEGGHCIEDHPPINEGWYYYGGGCFNFVKKEEPTHWRPLETLPQLPTTLKES